jgi:hypothetical protein
MRALGPLWRTDPRLSLLIGGKKHLLRQSRRTLGAMKMQMQLRWSVAAVPIRIIGGPWVAPGCPYGIVG